MTKLFFIILSVVLFASRPQTALAQSSERYSVARSVVASGGASVIASDRFQLGGTIGQPLAAVPGSARFSIQGGFWYLPAFEIVAANRVGTNFVFSFETEPGCLYSVQYSDSLTNPNWQTFANFTGDGIAKTVTQSAVGVANRFYRIRRH